MKNKMTDRTINKHISGLRKVGGDYFMLKHIRSSDKRLSDYIHLFNFDDYWCLKESGNQRIISYEDFLDFKYSGYTFFKKDIYDIENILIWVEWFKNIGGIKFLSKPTPPFPPTKIIIKKY